MVLGFNHNVVYQGEVFHVQTEDSGKKNPHIVTLLYRGGVILCSKKTSYSDILIMDNLDSVVEELMKAQHKDMLRRLKSGEFDERAFSLGAQPLENDENPSTGAKAETVPVLATEPRRIAAEFSSSSASLGSPSKSDRSMPSEIPVKKAAPAIPSVSQPAEKPTQDIMTLDEAILNFFNVDRKR